MKAVIERAQDINLWKIDDLLWQHIHDLQNEVRFHRPVDPPYNRRMRPVGGSTP